MRYLFPLIFLLAASTLSWARDLPADGLRADLTVVEYPYVKLAGKPMRLSPGARIFDATNRIVPPYPMTEKVNVLYTLDIRGDVQGIWFLTTEEAVVVDKRSPK
jgi:hypothetical protein